MQSITLLIKSNLCVNLINIYCFQIVRLILNGVTMSINSQKRNPTPQGETPETQTISKKRDRSASEERLLNAGLEIFSKYGFDGATTKMIAKKADVNESLIARYFEGKEGLLVAIIGRFLEDIRNRELRYPPQNNLADELACYIEERLHEAKDKIGFARIIFSQALVNKTFKKRALEMEPMLIDARLQARINLLSERGLLTSVNDAQVICEEIDTYLDGAFFFGLILHEEKVEDVVLKAVTFARRYAKLFSKV